MSQFVLRTPPPNNAFDRERPTAAPLGALVAALLGARTMRTLEPAESQDG